MKTVGYLSIIGICLATIVFMIYASFLSFYPFKVIDIKNSQSLPLDRSMYNAGQEINITFDYEKYVDISPIVRKEIVCDKSITVLSEGRRLPLGKGVVQLAHVVPLSTPTDNHCRIFIFIEYDVNPLQTQSMTLRTQEFSVINSKL